MSEHPNSVDAFSIVGASDHSSTSSFGVREHPNSIDDFVLVWRGV